MARKPLTDEQRAEGARISAHLRETRRSLGREQVEIARGAGVSVDELRAIEGRRVATPSFVVIARLARELELGLDPFAREVLRSDD
ncbi:MAG: helix-turn-helix domain-containing protein [Solirubrobacterales bacterium]